MAANLRQLWSDLREASDTHKRQAVELANRSRNTNREVKPLKPGDYVFVEYGDDEHSKRLGKAGLPRRRRFKVLEYHPDRFYVKIDTDGLRLNDKISLHRISRAPREYSVEDKSVPITRVERMGDPDMPLPPGWTAILRRGETKDYYSYQGPGGKGVATSKLQAWREFNGDPVYMPQPKQQRKSMPVLADPLKSVLPKESATTPLAVKNNKSSLASVTAVQADEILDAIRQLQRDNVQAEKMVHSWKLKYVPRKSGQAKGDWYATSPQGRMFRSSKELLQYLRPAAATDVSSLYQKVEPALGAGIEIYWTGDQKWFAGRVKRITSGENDTPVHQIAYDDGETRWHDLSVETWRDSPSSDRSVDERSQIRATMANAEAAHIVRQRQTRLKVLDAEYDEKARIQSVIWECEQGIWLCSAR